MQKIAPLGGARGIDVVIAEGNGLILETGTSSEEWMMLNELEVGPKGKKGVVLESVPILQVPSAPWAVIITRGASRE